MKFHKLTDRRITMVCYAEFSCYVHIGDRDHIRFEASTKVTAGECTYDLFPEVDYRALKVLLGSSIKDIKQQADAFELETDKGSIITKLSTGYESIMVVMDGITVTVY